MKTLMGITTVLLGAIATVLQQNALHWISTGEMALARTTLNAMWWVTGSCAVLGSTFIFLLVVEVKKLGK